MKLEVVLELRDVCGGDGVTRPEVVEERKLKRIRTVKTTRSDIGVAAGGAELEDEHIDLVERDVFTFRRDDQGRPIMRLGGVHGKLWGALREAAQQLRILGVQPFSKSYRAIVGMIQVTPLDATLEVDGSSMQIVKIPQPLAGGRGTMIFLKYDCIPKCRTTVVVAFPDQMAKPVEALIRHLEQMALLNRRKATAKIVSIKPV